MRSRWSAEKTGGRFSGHRRWRLWGWWWAPAATSVSGFPQPRTPRELIAVTPMGKAHSTLKDEDIVVTDFDAEPVEGDLTPSSETLLHLGVYRARPDVRAVLHTHSVFASVAAVAGLEIPPIVDEMTVAVGGAVKVSEYAFPGTQQLADSVCAALGERNAALIRNHGAVGVGSSVREALDVCALVERMAQVFIYASLLGKVNILPEDVVEAELAIYRMQRDALGGVGLKS